MDIYTDLISFDWTFVFILFNMVILYFIMKRYFFEKIRNFMVKRQNDIQDAFDSAEKREKDAIMLKEEYDCEFSQLETKGREVVKEAKIKADAQARDIISEAERKAAAILAQAEVEIEREKQRALADMKQEISALVLFAAEKVLEKQLDHKEQQGVIDKLLTETGSSSWQN